MLFTAPGFRLRADAEAAALRGIDTIKAQLTAQAEGALSGDQASPGAAPSISGVVTGSGDTDVPGFSYVDVDVRDSLGRPLTQRWVLPSSDAPLPRASRANALVTLPTIPSSLVTVFPSVPYKVPALGSGSTARTGCSTAQSISNATTTIYVTDTTGFPDSGYAFITAYLGGFRFYYSGRTSNAFTGVTMLVDFTYSGAYAAPVGTGVYADVLVPSGLVVTLNGTTKQFTTTTQWLAGGVGLSDGNLLVNSTARIGGFLQLYEVNTADRTECPPVVSYTITSPPSTMPAAQAGGSVYVWHGSESLVGAVLRDAQNVEYVITSGGLTTVGGEFSGAPTGAEGSDVPFVRTNGYQSLNPGSQLTFVAPPLGVKATAVCKTNETATVVPAASLLTNMANGKVYRTRSLVSGVGDQKIPIEAVVAENASDLIGTEVLTWTTVPRGASATCAVADVEQAIAYPNVATPTAVIGSELQFDVDVRLELDGTWTAIVGTRPLGS
jgi:hypothetical protein